jgi:hypothetical protein
MVLDPIPEDVRAYLRKHFLSVTDEASQGDYYVFSVIASGTPRVLKVHRNFFIFSELAARYLQDQNIAGQLERGNIEIAKPGL